MRIAFGTDERTEVSDRIKAALAERGHDVAVVGEGDPWPDVGRRVGEAVAAGEVDRGVVCCWTGTGVSMAANKVPGVRAALCTDPETAAGALASLLLTGVAQAASCGNSAPGFEEWKVEFAQQAQAAGDPERQLIAAGHGADGTGAERRE